MASLCSSGVVADAGACDAGSTNADAANGTPARTGRWVGSLTRATRLKGLDEMGLFSSKRRNEESDVVALRRELDRTISGREMADIQNASQRVDRFVNEILRDSGNTGNAAAAEWVRDRLRMFILVGVSPGWMELVEQSSAEAGKLRAEHLQLARNVAAFGPEHLVAWWVHLSPELFGQGIDHQFEQMRGALTDLARQHRDDPTAFVSDRVDWQSFFAPE